MSQPLLAASGFSVPILYGLPVGCYPETDTLVKIDDKSVALGWPGS